jgi:hypothetical protein
MIARSVTILLMISIACSSSRKNELGSSINFSNEKVVELISSLEIDPRSELPIYVVVSERLSQNVTLLTVCQSKSRSRNDFVRSFKDKGHDVFIYDLSREEVHQMFFDTDSPTWNVMVSSSSGKNRYFLIKPLTPIIAGDSVRRWRVD